MSIFDTLYGFNPNVIQQQNYAIPRPSTSSVPTITPIGVTTDLNAVNGDDGAKQFSMRPNSRVALFDINDDVVFIKQTDSNNYPTIRKFRLTEIVEETPVNNAQQYVTIDEFNKLREELLNGQQSIRESIAAASSTDAKSARTKPAKKSNADVSDSN